MNEVNLTTMLLAFLGAASVFLVMWMLVSWYLSSRQVEAQRRMRPAEDSDPTLLLNDLRGVGGRYSWWVRLKRTLHERLERTELRLEVAEAAAIVLFCGVVLGAIVFFWRYDTNPDDDESWMALPAFVVGAAIPLVFFLFRQKAWRRRVQDQLPDTIFLLARSLRAGMSIDQSIQVIGDHGVAPTSREFARMHRQLDLGLALPQVLQITADRVHLVDFSVFASVLSLHRLTGGNLPIIMDRLATTTREHNQLRAHYRTATSLGRYGNTIILCLVTFVLFYMAFYQRDMTEKYFETTAGMVMFGIGMTLEVVGLFLLFYLLGKEED